MASRWAKKVTPRMIDLDLAKQGIRPLPVKNPGPIERLGEGETQAEGQGEAEGEAEGSDTQRATRVDGGEKPIKKANIRWWNLRCRRWLGKKVNQTHVCHS